MDERVTFVLVLAAFLSASPSSGAVLRRGRSWNAFGGLFAEDSNYDGGSAEGSLVPCNDADPPFALKWSPKDIRPGENVSVSFEMTPTVDVRGGHVEVSVWLDGFLLINQVKSFSCALINRYLPHLCPARKGEPIRIVDHVLETKGIPTMGSFTVRVKITNEKGELFACMKGSFRIDSGSDDYSYYSYDSYKYDN